MELFIEKDDKVVEDHLIGVKGEYLIVHKALENRIEIWDSDAEAFYAHLPCHSDITHISAALRMFETGLKLGEQRGRRRKAEEIRRALEE